MTDMRWRTVWNTTVRGDGLPKVNQVAVQVGGCKLFFFFPVADLTKSVSSELWHMTAGNPKELNRLCSALQTKLMRYYQSTRPILPQNRRFSQTLNFQVVGLVLRQYSQSYMYTYTLVCTWANENFIGELSCKNRSTGSAKTAKNFPFSVLQSFS